MIEVLVKTVRKALQLPKLAKTFKFERVRGEFEAKKLFLERISHKISEKKSSFHAKSYSPK